MLDSKDPAGRRAFIARVSLLCLSTVFLFADQNLTAPNLSAIADDFGFDPVTRDLKLGGEVNFSFFIVGGLVSLVIGPMADWMDRRDLFVYVVLMGNIPCLLTYYVSSYWQFFLLRTLTGISIGGATPVLFSLFSDMFPPSQRIFASTVVAGCMGVGVALGQIVAGFVGPTYGWRVPFLIVAFPSLALAAVIKAVVVDPRTKMGSAKGAAEEAHPSLSIDKLRSIFKVKTNQYIFAQAVPGCLPWGVINTYLSDYLHERGLSVQGATKVVIIFGIGSLLGLVAGGGFGQRLYNKRKGLLGLYVGTSVMLGIPPFLYLINHEWADDNPDLLPLIVAFSAGVTAVCSPNAKACLMNVNGPKVRGTVFSVYTIMDDLGKGLGPGLIAILITSIGRRAAFCVGILGWVPCAFFNFMVSYSLAKDEEAIRSTTLRP